MHAALHPTPPSVPALGIALTTDQVTAAINAMQKWSSDTGARLLDLDAALGSLPTAQQHDHTLAFVLWQATDQAIQDARSSTSAFADIRLASLRKPVVDNTGSQLATNVVEAGKIIGALIDATQNNIETHAGALAATAAISNDLAVCSPLVKSLSMSASHFSQLLERSANASLATDPAATSKLAIEVSRLRSDLEAAERERTALINELAKDSERIAVLRTLEADARIAMDAALAKVSNVARRGIVSVDALGSAPDMAALANSPWPAQRTALRDRSVKLQRAEQSLQEVINTHIAYLAERNELRQVVDAFRAKAMAAHIGEIPAVSDAYDAARALLWSAPTDLVAARQAVADYQKLVNTNQSSKNISGVQR
jgi:hypothetical protein